MTATEPTGTTEADSARTCEGGAAAAEATTVGGRWERRDTETCPAVSQHNLRKGAAPQWGRKPTSSGSAALEVRHPEQPRPGATPQW